MQRRGKESRFARHQAHSSRNKTNHSLLAAYLFSFRVLLDILRQLSHTKLIIGEAKTKHMSTDIIIEQHPSKIVF